ncbi:MAG: hypothetical protein JWQ07_2775 [Ramlibacter sp.]|nr:hypothetical protein [Ramlibacter sp.]
MGRWEHAQAFSFQASESVAAADSLGMSRVDRVTCMGGNPGVPGGARPIRQSRAELAMINSPRPLSPPLLAFGDYKVGVNERLLTAEPALEW